MKRNLLFWSGLFALFIGMQQCAGRGLISGSAPPLLGATLDGKPFDGAGFRGRPMVIYFWASWCSICKMMQGAVDAVAKDIPVVSVALLSGDAAEVRRHAEREKIAVPVVLDEDGRIAATYGVRGVPAVFIVGPDGKIRFSTVGFTSEWGIRARVWLAGWL
jgi:thiol-disulfide isomerase/thioredoxin